MPGKSVRVTGGVIDSAATESRQQAEDILKLINQMDIESLELDDDHIQLLVHHKNLIKAYIAVYDEAKRLEEMTVARQRKIAELQQEVYRLKNAVHRENHAVRRNFMARFWEWLTLRG